MGQLDQPGLGIEVGGEGGGQGGQVHGLGVRIDAVKESQDRRGQAAVFRGVFLDRHGQGRGLGKGFPEGGDETGEHRRLIRAVRHQHGVHIAHGGPAEIIQNDLIHTQIRQVLADLLEISLGRGLGGVQPALAAVIVPEPLVPGAQQTRLIIMAQGVGGVAEGADADHHMLIRGGELLQILRADGGAYGALGLEGGLIGKGAVREL